MKFSFVTSFRDRSIENVERSIKSIINQSYNDFELIVVDYGSEPENSKKIKDIINAKSNYVPIKYIFSNSKGLYWNRAHALNTGFFQSNGDYIIACDIDLIYPEYFLDKINYYLEVGIILHYRVMSFPQKYINYDNVFSEDFRKLKYPISNNHGLGLFCCHRKYIEITGGYDENFKIWGAEDQELNKRLQSYGLIDRWIPFNECPVVHQWHRYISETALLSNRIEGWTSVIKNRVNNREYNVKTYIRNYPGYILLNEDRPVLTVIKKNLDPFIITKPLSRSFIECIKCFELLKPGSPFLIRIIKTISKKRRNYKQFLFYLLNILFEKTKSNYLIVRRNEFLYTKLDDNIKPVEAMSLIFYYFLDRNTSTYDYYLDENSNCLDIYLVKG